MISERNRLDPSLLDEEQINQLAAAFSTPGHVAVINSEGERMEIPEALFEYLSRMLHLIKEKKSIMMVPVDEQFTTQAAANYLGVSRQHLVDLLEAGEIPFHKTGTHRRIAFQDLLEYEAKRDQARKSTLDHVFDEVSDAGKYDSDFAGETR